MAHTQSFMFPAEPSQNNNAGLVVFLLQGIRHQVPASDIFWMCISFGETPVAGRDMDPIGWEESMAGGGACAISFAWLGCRAEAFKLEGPSIGNDFKINL